ncbi:hypothetical protein DICPUDRAFT_99296 [Dictyostelium purpureum]|uniref:V-type proton ATPase subunit S1/VOA1 transmembrane domain-containing protein n=1 Tax=Dictyostelium purpureum TaxID=5786 RepID=F0ZY16_DICPU|nr:uncharacterized protein DICPUDRAFT_99296 [Dictyostelium purpureum]EGC31164.1 hypothetical protein DICPUDRAFT_99296 [Dictyostelium purpureum]|eukprot:XP_003292311.1 hypothetical protein DICPUDRAFT_99296 [Dictyostelium purpureum]
MKAAIIFILFNILLGVVLSTYVPILGWSSQEKLFKKTHISHKYNQDQFKNLIQSIVDENNVETLTIFVEPKLRTDQLSNIIESYSSHNNGGEFKSLMKSFEKSKSSVYIPYSLGGVSKILSEIKGSILVYGQAEIKGAKQINELSEIRSTLSNGKVDIVVVVLDKNQDETIRKVESIVEKSSFASFFTAESAQEFNIQENYVKQMSESKVVTKETINNNPDLEASSEVPTHHKYFNFFTGPVLESYLIVGILLAILFTGLCCITDLQVPDRCEVAPKQKLL